MKRLVGVVVARSLPGAILAAMIAGCGGSSDTVSAKDMNRLVLRQQDLGSPFASFYSGPQRQLDNQGTPRANPQRNGREGGWIARYHRPGSSATAGPLVVESRVDVFKGAGGAKVDLDLYRTAFGSAPGAQAHLLAPPGIGDTSVAATFVQPGVKPLRFYRIAWRYRNATASVTAEGFDHRLRLAQAVALARKQQRLLTHA
jgi:hypothetical protein